jgi:hypothetical protein
MALPSPTKPGVCPRAPLRADPWALGLSSPAVRERSFVLSASWPLARTAGESGERSETGEGCCRGPNFLPGWCAREALIVALPNGRKGDDRWRFRRAFSTSCVVEYRFQD